MCVVKDVCVPLRSVPRIKCFVAFSPGPFLVEPLPFLLTSVLIPRSLHNIKKETEVFLISPLDITYKLRRGNIIGKSDDVSVLKPYIELSEGVPVGSVGTSDTPTLDILLHLLDLWSRSLRGWPRGNRRS